MKIKAIKRIPSSDCYFGLDIEKWIKLNAGKRVSVDKVSDKLLEFVEVIEEKPKEEKG